MRGILENSRLHDEQLEFRELDLSEIARDCVSDLADQIEEASAEVRATGGFPKDLGSPGLLARMFQNLRSNAMNCRAPGRACVVEISAAADIPGKIARQSLDCSQGRMRPRTSRGSVSGSRFPNASHRCTGGDPCGERDRQQPLTAETVRSLVD